MMLKDNCHLQIDVLDQKLNALEAENQRLNNSFTRSEKRQKTLHERMEKLKEEEKHNNRENRGGGQTVGNSEMTAFAEFAVRCVLDWSCPLSPAEGGDFLGASGWA